MPANINVTKAMKALLLKLSVKDVKLHTYERRPVGAPQWTPNHCYFLLAPGTMHFRSPVRTMVWRMEQVGLITWREISVTQDRKSESRCLEAVVTAKAKSIGLMASAQTMRGRMP